MYSTDFQDLSFNLRIVLLLLSLFSLKLKCCIGMHLKQQLMVLALVFFNWIWVLGAIGLLVILKRSFKENYLAMLLNDYILLS